MGGIGMRRLLGPLMAIILLLPLPRGAQSAHGYKLELRKVFEFKLDSWNWPLAFLDPEGGKIYLLQESEVQVIDWRKGRAVASASYADIPCESAVKLAGWSFIPRRAEILAAYCGSLFLIDGATLGIKKQLVHRLASGGLAISPDGEAVAVSVSSSRTEWNFDPYIALFDTANWEVVQRWPVYPDGLSFSSDGKLLAIGRSKTNEEERVVAHGVEIRQIPSGEVYAEWWRDKDDVSFREPFFVPDDSNSIVTLTLGGSEVLVWDLKQKEIKKRMQSPRRINGFLLSPDGRWVIADVADDPQDTPQYSQDFIVWDLFSGQIVYESPKKKWNPFARLIDLFEDSELQLNNLSQDGKYLLVTEYKRLILYEVITELSQGTGGAQP